MATDPAADELGPTLATLSHWHRATVAKIVSDVPHGPRGFHVLALAATATLPSQASVATCLGIDRTVMTYLIDDLVGAGLVERRPDPTDRRRKVVTLTDAGSKLYGELRLRVREAEDHFLLGSLDDDERTALRALLRRVTASLGHQPAADYCRPS